MERLLRGWDGAVVAAWFADNMELDLDPAHRRAAIEELVAAVGPLLEPPSPDGIVRSDSPAHLVWRVRGARGVLRCEIRLNPQDPPKIQSLEVTVDARPPARERAAAERPTI